MAVSTLRIAALWLFLASAPLVRAAPPLALEVQGKISRTNDASHTVYRISEAELLKLPVHTIVTSTRWTRKSTFTGPLFSDVLKLVGATGRTVDFVTLDDYTVSMPANHAEAYGAILAYTMDGKRLEVRDFGPFFLVYPRDAYPSELTGAAADARFVWQVKALILK
ncbi:MULTISPECIES: molybdopterin-dependent oxidoreductase [unclassified Caballeronia]|uniref:molybdopterin-dependent oxidoreductase n=1 Tax=unclassified Caballeronia TaxID=2646786 RepID=UPI002863F0FB|nr:MULTISPECIES: molybdopterin-dependent oxidoreductase [unclassified Caballeronia]MDR5753935.1 molybdopterin-dependent oxidoreductase [Caballeronia sp. LZ024]MDR5840314.1 molybdopterin-dependent oxidoreductase [Caballeronia sp. LZ031]